MSSDSSVKIVKIPVNKIKIPEVRARARWTEEQIQFLRASMSKFGITQYPIVRPVGNGEFELIDGEHRIKVAKELGKDEIEVLVVPMDEKDAAIANLMMNVARGEQDPIGAAIALKKAVDSGMKIEEVAKAVNRSPQWVKFMISLLDLPEEFQEALKEGKLNVTHIREAARLPDANEIYEALATAIRLGWPASTLKHYVENRLEQLRIHAQTVQETGVATPPPPPEPEKLVRFSQCLICGRMVEREKIYLPACCDECYNLARYAVSQLGTGEKGMNLLYQALSHYTAYLQYQQQFFAQQQMQKTGWQFTPPQQQGQNVNENVNVQTQRVIPSPPGVKKAARAGEGEGQSQA